MMESDTTFIVSENSAASITRKNARQASTLKIVLWTGRSMSRYMGKIQESEEARTQVTGFFNLGILASVGKGPVRQPRKSRLSANKKTRRINPTYPRTFYFLPKPPKKFVVRSNFFR